MNDNRFLNREVSWLAFNNRVLALSQEPGIPLLERAKFCAIAATNLDEFFQVRVAALRDLTAKFARFVRRRMPPGKRWHLAVGHANAPAEAARLQAALMAGRDDIDQIHVAGSHAPAAQLYRLASPLGLLLLLLAVAQTADLARG